MDRLTIIFPSNDPSTGKVMSGYEGEYRGFIKLGSFDIAPYNEYGYLHGDPPVVLRDLISNEIMLFSKV